MPVANLEIFLYRHDTGSDSTSYGIELRFADPQSEADKRQGASSRCASTRKSCTPRRSIPRPTASTWPPTS